jgi:hypothetical protein
LSSDWIGGGEEVRATIAWDQQNSARAANRLSRELAVRDPWPPREDNLKNSTPGEYAMKPAEVLNLLKEKEAKFVDLRFTDFRGKEQHVTIPAHTVDESFFDDGKMFDGSSISGWKGISESDML